ncbi:MAG: GNAT family N-acetyltransferase [Flavobacteriaceae bacterium]|nr:GNAT family N-acetyltransferase [Flavobacteriaceae bacterium]
MEIIIRPIQQKDNPHMAKIIRGVFEDFGEPTKGTAYEDVALDIMYETYQKPNAHYFVAEENNIILGGGGIAPLENYQDHVCELQKMYFQPSGRGRGIGAMMMEACLKAAVDTGFTQCYLETIPYMKAAQRLYKKYDFKTLDDPLGDTGHYSCGVRMLKDLLLK